MVQMDLIKNYLDSLYGFDILKKGRKRQVVYSRIVFVSILVEYGFTNRQIKNKYNINHDMCIFYRKSLIQIMPIDLVAYNSCIEYFQLPVPIYSSVNAIDKNPTTAAIIDQLLKLGRRDIKYFNNKVFKPFIKNLELEKSITEV